MSKYTVNVTVQATVEATCKAEAVQLARWLAGAGVRPVEVVNVEIVEENA